MFWYWFNELIYLTFALPISQGWYHKTANDCTMDLFAQTKITKEKAYQYWGVDED